MIGAETEMSGKFIDGNWEGKRKGISVGINVEFEMKPTREDKN